MLVTLNETLKIADEKKIALGGFNITNLESLRSVLGAAEKLQLPVALMFAQIHAHMIPLSLIGPVIVRCAEEAAVPVTAHLDHGADLEYLKQALDMGFTSIMYDGSQLPYEENLENTRKAVELAAKPAVKTTRKSTRIRNLPCSLSRNPVLMRWHALSAPHMGST